MTQDANSTPEPGAMPTAEQPVAAIHDTLSRFLGAADVKSVYGTPIKESGVTVIPCAEIISAVGFGVGSGYGTGRSTTDQNAQQKAGAGGGGSGGGGGGGGRVLSRPVATIVVTADGVEVKPIIDITKLGLAGITAWGFMLTMIMRIMTRRQKPGKLG